MKFKFFNSNDVIVIAEKVTRPTGATTGNTGIIGRVHAEELVHIQFQ